MFFFSILFLQIDNSKYVLTKIATLYAERLMNDICLVVGGIEYPAHRLILCASSEVFQVGEALLTPDFDISCRGICGYQILAHIFSEVLHVSALRA